ncbi:MAG TPA: excinuclease ABC subunit UvrC [Candidatus Norongarragalinales archaeon]|nr:excinuclease ABC subunit UvrC [Candidatus Norongarragalinales archaeon]
MLQIASKSDFTPESIPNGPGVYLYRDGAGEIIYIGKAKSLRSRVRSYFANSEQPAKTQMLVSKIRSIDWIVVGSEVEALLLENKPVKRHLPKYNINLKDSKTFAYIALTRETYPRIITTRKLSSKLEAFGPYTDGYMRMNLNEAAVKVFKLRVCKTLPRRACLNFHIGLCTAPCIGNVTKEQYGKQVEDARAFLKGNYGGTLAQLNYEMDLATHDENYERALELRNQISSINLLTQKQVVDKDRDFDQDVMAFRRLGEKMLIVQMGIRKGVLLGKKEFAVDLQTGIEQEFLKAYYSSNQIPKEILLNKACWFDESEKYALEEFFSKSRGGPVHLVVPERADKLALIKLAERNIEANLEEDSALLDLQAALNLPTLPRIIECFDISNLGREHVVSGMARFANGKPDKGNYRKFKIKTVEGQDDFASMNEVVGRRYRGLMESMSKNTGSEKSNGELAANERTNGKLPDLILIDGGPGQVNAAKSALKTLGLQIPLIGLAKKFEEIYLPDEAIPRKFDKMGRMMLLLRRIRDETHRFSIGYNRKRREMKMREEFSTG